MKKRLAYAGYIIGVTALCLYFLFPGNAVTSYINYKINSIFPDVKWTFHDVKPAFPPGLSSSLLELSRKDRKIIGVEQVKIAPSLISLLTSDKVFRITGNACGGDLDAKVILSKINHAPKIELNTVISGIQLSKIPMLKELKLCQASGSVAGTVAFSNKEPGPGKGTIQAKITDSQIRFTPALFGIAQVTFKIVTAEFALTGEQVVLKRLDIDSRELSGTATGSMILKNPIEKSRINITGEVSPHPGILKQLGNQFPVELISGMKTKTGGIPFRVSGSLEQPNFSLK